jgi:hypothetical protein
MNPTKISRTRKGLVWMAAGAAAFGVGIGAASIASAASDSSSTTVVATNTAASDTAANTAGSSAATPAAPPNAPHVDPASLPNGPGETVLTGDTLAKVTAAAEAADPGATLIRAETDSGGHAYEAHMKNADGTVTTLYFNSSFAADGTDMGFGPGRPGDQGGPGGVGHGGPQGQPPVQPSTSGSTTGA